MVYKAILKTEGEKRDILSFSSEYFQINPSSIFEWKKNNQFDLYDSLIQNMRIDTHTYKAKGQVFGGIFSITIESTEDDELFYYRFKDTRIMSGCIEFYNIKDEDIPFYRIDFWDGWIPTISEQMCSTSSKPMVLSFRLSAATYRYNNKFIFQKNWFITEIDQQEIAITETYVDPVISKISWRGKKGNYISVIERKDIMLNHSIDLEIEFSEGIQGDEVELIVKQSKKRQIKGKSTEFSINGKIDENKTMIIQNFKVECNFKEDNQNFGNIEFYHKKKKVGELKENFGWVYIKENGLLKIMVNIDLNILFLPSGLTETRLKNEMNAIFERTLMKSSKNTVTGKLFFSGTRSRELPQFVPELSILKQNDPSQLGLAILGYVSAYIDSKTTPSTIIDATETVVHELLHSLRIDHPFETTQYLRKPNPIIGDPEPDTKLVVVKGEFQSSYKTLPTTDPNIKYNIMNYDNIYIDGELLKDLWERKRPEFLTKGQLQIIFDEIDSQQNGAGTVIIDKESNLPSQGDYWDKDLRGDSLRPERNFYKNPKRYDD